MNISATAMSELAAYARSRAGQDGEDLLSRAFEKTIRAGRSSLPEAELVPYLKVAVRRLAGDLAARRRETEELNPWMGDADPAIEDRAEVVDVRAALAALPEEQRMVILLTDYQGLSYAEAAQRLEVQVSTIGSRRNRALAAMRRTLETAGI